MLREAIAASGTDLAVVVDRDLGGGRILSRDIGRVHAL